MKPPAILTTISRGSWRAWRGLLLSWVVGIPLCAQTPNRQDHLYFPLRYRPDAGAFVIENGQEYFNRPLYGGPTAFRVDAGDRPEFSLYLPGRGGNLRLGFRTAGVVKWLQESDQVIARYRPGGMEYSISDAALGRDTTIEISAYALAVTKGLLLRAEIHGPDAGVELLAAYGGVTGKRGRRDGDIGTEEVPIGEYFQLRPGYCAENRIVCPTGSFILSADAATMVGEDSESTLWRVADAQDWAAPAKLFAGESTKTTRSSELPLAITSIPLRREVPVFLGVQKISAPLSGDDDLETYREVRTEKVSAVKKPLAVPLLPALAASALADTFIATEKYFRAQRAHVAVATPDPYIDLSVSALNVAAEAVWDDAQQDIMHGAIAWRTRLLGWRGPYLLDALGEHERARVHFRSWAAQQNLSPVPENIPAADTDSHLARSETALHSTGDLSRSHYDMNLVYIDALFRHLEWTGDLALARELWPMIERHLAWERRLFRREYGAEKLPLYEAYAAIWASDDLSYNGGGAAHASAYNFDHNRQAAQLARQLGLDGTPYEREAALIARAMRSYLWLPASGQFAEYRDWLGSSPVAHPAAALWTTYHTIDSGLPTAEEAWAMTRAVDRTIPHLPVQGPGVPRDLPYAVLATSSWMPYLWSINNVVMGENLHTALAFWQAGRNEAAFRLTKSALLASMYMGICPGNSGSMNLLDVYRRESQRDFADGSGVMSRAIVEGLFGVRPRLLENEILVAPGFPANWPQASIAHPDFSLRYERHESSEKYYFQSRFPRPVALRWQVPMRSTVAQVLLNGRPVAAHRASSPEAAPRLEFLTPASATTEISIVWSGAVIKPFPEVSDEWAKDVAAAAEASRPEEARGRAFWTQAVAPSARWETLDFSAQFNDRVTEIFRPGKYLSPRSPFASLALPSQGIGAWAGGVNETAKIDDAGLRAAAGATGKFELPNGILVATPGTGPDRNVIFVSQWNNYPRFAQVSLTGQARRAVLLVAGSTNPMQSRIANGEIVIEYQQGPPTILPLRNPETWWPIEQDYFLDDFQFRDDAPLPARLDLQTGKVRLLDRHALTDNGKIVSGGAATLLTVDLDPKRKLRSLTIRALANEVVIGLMAVSLERSDGR